MISTEDSLLVLREIIKLDISHSHVVEKINKIHKINKLNLNKNLIEQIKKHKLARYLYESNFIKENFTDFHLSIKKLIDEELRINLIQQKHLIMISKILIKDNISHLFFKGIPLSIQLTNNPFGRGASSDLDLLIKESEIQKVVNCLQKNKYKIVRKYSPFLEDSFIGKYCRFICPELDIFYEDRNLNCNIDLHWRLSWIRKDMPKFEEVYLDKRTIFLNDFKLYTLSNYHSFIHLCTNAAVDNWMCLRNLLDIDLLSKKLTQKDIFLLKKIKIVEISSRIAFELTGNKRLLELFDQDKEFKQYLRISLIHQKLSWRSLGIGGWTIKNRIKYLLGKLMISDNFKDRLSFILILIFNPNDIYDVNQKKKRNLILFFKYRLYKLLNRI